MTYRRENPITVTITCTCEDELHEVELNRDGSGGYAEGDVLCCGRVVDYALVEQIQREFFERGTS